MKRSCEANELLGGGDEEKQHVFPDAKCLTFNENEVVEYDRANLKHAVQICFLKFFL